MDNSFDQKDDETPEHIIEEKEKLYAILRSVARFMRYYMANRHLSYPYEVWKVYNTLRKKYGLKPVTYDHVRRYFFILKNLNLIDLVAYETSKGKWKRYKYGLIESNLSSPLWYCPAIVFTAKNKGMTDEEYRKIYKDKYRPKRRVYQKRHREKKKISAGLIPEEFEAEEMPEEVIEAEHKLIKVEQPPVEIGGEIPVKPEARKRWWIDIQEIRKMRAEKRKISGYKTIAKYAPENISVLLNVESRALIFVISELKEEIDYAIEAESYLKEKGVEIPTPPFLKKIPKHMNTEDIIKEKETLERVSSNISLILSKYPNRLTDKEQEYLSDINNRLYIKRIKEFDEELKKRTEKT